MSIFVKLNQAADKVLKDQVAAPERKEMTLNEFAAYATDQIEKAAEERDENPAMATARLKSLAISNIVAQAAFEKLSLDKFEIPVFGANAEMDISVMAKLDVIMDSVDKAGKNPFADKDKDKDKKKADEKETADKKAADEKSAADKKAADEKTAADEKEVADKKAADEKAATQKGEGGEEVDDDGEIWPQDMAKGLGASKEVKELYDWGKDPPEVRANMPGHG